MRDNLEILNALPPVQSAEIEDNPRLYALLAAMVKSNEHLFSLYVGYDDGSFIEMDDIGGTGRDSRARLEAPEHAAFRLVVISRSGDAVKSRRIFLSDKLETIRELPGPLDYDPRERPWYKDAMRRDGSWLTGPYIFFATGRQGYTFTSPLKQGRGGVVAGDLLMDATQEVLKREKLTASGVAFLFDDDDRILAHPRMPELLGREVPGTIPRLRKTDMGGVLGAIRAWRENWVAEQFFHDPGGRLYAASFQTIPRSGVAGLRVAVVAPVDEFFANILSERGRLFAATLGFVAAMVPVVFFIGALLSRSLRALAAGNRPDSALPAAGGAAGAFGDPRDRRTRPLRLHHAHAGADVFEFRSKTPGPATRGNRRCDETRRHAARGHRAVHRCRQLHRDSPRTPTRPR